MTNEQYLRTAGRFYVDQIKAATVSATIFTSFAEADIRSGTDPDEAIAAVTYATINTVADVFDAATAAMDRFRKSVSNPELIEAMTEKEIEDDAESFRELTKALMTLDFTMGLLEDVSRKAEKV